MYITEDSYINKPSLWRILYTGTWQNTKVAVVVARSHWIAALVMKWPGHEANDLQYDKQFYSYYPERLYAVIYLTPAY